MSKFFFCNPAKFFPNFRKNFSRILIKFLHSFLQNYDKIYLEFWQRYSQIITIFFRISTLCFWIFVNFFLNSATFFPKFSKFFSQISTKALSVFFKFPWKFSQIVKKFYPNLHKIKFLQNCYESFAKCLSNFSKIFPKFSHISSHFYQHTVRISSEFLPNFKTGVFKSP